jgi:hypothetical protein
MGAAHPGIFQLSRFVLLSLAGFTTVGYERDRAIRSVICSPWWVGIAAAEPAAVSRHLLVFYAAFSDWLPKPHWVGSGGGVFDASM